MLITWPYKKGPHIYMLITWIYGNMVGASLQDEERSNNH